MIELHLQIVHFEITNVLMLERLIINNEIFPLNIIIIRSIYITFL